MSRAERIDARLEALYAQVPEINCKGLCTDSCGPVDGGMRERARMARSGYRLPTRDQIHYVLADAAAKGHTDDVPNCPALGVDGRCRAYEVRPMICRLWGAIEDMPCPHGCRPEPPARLLTRAEGFALLEAANTAETGLPTPSAEEIQAILDLMPPDARSGFERIIRASRPT